MDVGVEAREDSRVAAAARRRGRRGDVGTGRGVVRKLSRRCGSRLNSWKGS